MSKYCLICKSTWRVHEVGVKVSALNFLDKSLVSGCLRGDMPVFEAEYGVCKECMEIYRNSGASKAVEELKQKIEEEVAARFRAYDEGNKLRDQFNQLEELISTLSSPVDDDPRMHYVEVQVDRVIWEKIRKIRDGVLDRMKKEREEE